MAETGPVLCSVSENGQLLRLILNAPKGNILDKTMIGALVEALTEHNSPRLKAIVFEGAGAHFSFGASVAEHRKEEAPAMLQTFHALFRLLLKMAVPTIAAVRGQCKGGGLELASYCTWIFASPDAALGQPEIKLAVFPPMASVILPWRLGGGAALDLCVSGRTLSAADAHHLGLVSEVNEDPERKALLFAREQLFPTSASSLRFAERAARSGLAREFDTTLPQLEKLYVDELMETADANEGIAAFLERRKPLFGQG
ncbi:MAG: enoyl-CoA hydratase/isomerase family protein [Polyangiaceae bacterium]|nr:enoyl-CoA hydratase/isomerase family protein [Polyangiaceae bacterium]